MMMWQATACHLLLTLESSNYKALDIIRESVLPYSPLLKGSSICQGWEDMSNDHFCSPHAMTYHIGSEEKDAWCMVLWAWGLNPGQFRNGVVFFGRGGRGRGEIIIK